MERPLILKEKENFNRINNLDWSKLQEQYSGQSIDKIIDEAGASLTRRVTSYPTPLARMHFFEDAFQFVVDSGKIAGDTIFHEAVSHCLDVWEILFNYDVFKDNLNIRSWKYAAIDNLKQSDDAGHRILGKSLDMYLQQDNTIQLNNTTDEIYLLSYDGQLFAGSSPFTGFFTVDFKKDSNGHPLLPFEIKVPGSANVKYFETIRSIDERDEEFQEYLYRLMKSQNKLADYFTYFYRYIDSYVKNTDEKQRLSLVQNPDFILLEYDGLVSQVSYRNNVLDVPKYENIEFDTNSEICLLNKHVFSEGKEIRYENSTHNIDIQHGIKIKKRSIKISNNCDFIIDTEKEKYKDLKVLALKQRPDGKLKKYIGAYWDKDIEVVHYNEIENWKKRAIPSWNIEHPFLVMNDLLEEYLVELPYNINTDAFVTCSVDNSKYLLPIKPLYFDFFGLDDLENNLKIEKSGEGKNLIITANLTIPLINNHKITFSRAYSKSSDFRTYQDIHSSENGKGHIIEYNLGLMIFPFLKTSDPKFNDFYKIACIDGNLSIPKEVDLFFYDADESEPIVIADDILKLVERVKKLYNKQFIVGSKYYQLTGRSFDYIRAEFPVEEQIESINALILPTWYRAPQPIHGEKFTFAVDFGTTNSHVAYKKGDITSNVEPRPFTISEDKMQIARLDTPNAPGHVISTEKFDTQHENDDDFIDRIVRKQRNEFIPSILGEVYKSPFRTAMSQKTTATVSKDNFDMFGNINIAFALNKRFEENPTWKIHTNLKWSSDTDTQGRVEYFIKELLYLMRTKVILEQGDPKEVRLYWFTPLNMAPTIYNNLKTAWNKHYKDIFNTTNEAMSISESEAPFYDKRASFGNNEVLSIDIGGMTTDVLYIQQQQPMFGSSFSFAGNALYGDFPNTEGKDNGFVTAFKEKIKNNIISARDNTSDEYKKNRYKEALQAYEWYFKQDKMNSDDIISFFYSDEGYNFAEILKNSYDFKIVFLIHYTAIIYHCAQLIDENDTECPGDIYFSGNGSLMFGIIDAPYPDLLGRIASKIFQKVIGEEVGNISIHLSDNPKEASCNGALKSQIKQTRTSKGIKKHIILGENINWGDKKPENPAQPTYLDIQNARKNFKPENSEYYKFIDLFFELYKSEDFENNFGIQLDVEKMIKILKDDSATANYHFRGLGWQTHKGSKQDAAITETVFFYPVMGGINKLLAELSKKMRGEPSEL